MLGVDKFPRMTDYVLPAGVRIADADRVRLGAHLAEGTTVMHEGFVNYNAGTLGTSMVEGRISAGVVVGEGSDVGGGASIMGTLSGGGKEVVSVGRRCLLGANAGIGISLGDDCVVEAGCYVTAGTKVTVLGGDEAPGGQGRRAVRRQQRAVPPQLHHRRRRGGAVGRSGHRAERRPPCQLAPRRDVAAAGSSRRWPACSAWCSWPAASCSCDGGIGPLPDPEGCTARVGGTVVDLSTEQAENATTIAAVAVRRGLPARAVSIALATAFQESKLRNLDHGDRDSVGLFQQRPSQGWGTAAQIQQPVYAANRFYDALEKVDGYQTMRITEAAQKVQRSGFPEAYEDHAADGRALASALTGYSRGAFTCVVRRGDGLAAAARGRRRPHRPRRAGPCGADPGLRRPVDRRVRPRRRLDRPRRGVGALRGPGRRRVRPARQRDQQAPGWAMASYLVAARGTPGRRPRHLRRPHLGGRWPLGAGLARLRRPGRTG